MVLYSRKLSYHDYGQFQSVWIYTNILSVVLNFGLSSIVLSSRLDLFVRFVKNNLSKLVWVYFGGALLCFCVFFFSTRLFSSQTKLLLIAFIVLQNLCSLTDSLLIKQHQLGAYLGLNMFYTLSFFSIHLYFFYQPFVLNHLILSISFLSLIKSSGIFLLRFREQNDLRGEPQISIRDNWIFIGLNEVAGIISRWLDKLFLLYLLSPAEFAIFFNGSFEVPLFGVLISAMENIMLTGISADLFNKEAARNVFREGFRILSMIAFPLFFFLLVMHSELFELIFDNKYNASIPVFLVYLLLIPVRINHYGVLLQSYGQSKKIAFGSLMDIMVSLLLMYLLYPLTGTIGIALAIVISTYLQAGYYLWESARMMQLSIAELVPVKYLLKWLLALALLYGLLYILKDQFSSYVSLPLVFAITLLIIVCRLVLYWRTER